MLRPLRVRLRQGHRTMKFPKGAPPDLPERFRGRPLFDAEKCEPGCGDCRDGCPTGAITIEGKPALDLGRCLFCTDCLRACSAGAISFTQEYRMATSRREDLVIDGSEFALAAKLGEDLRKVLGRSLKLRHVSAGGCNGCEMDTNVLGTIGWDLGRFGIQLVASPRHADGLIVTGAVSANMHAALLKTYEAVAEPKIVIAVGACAISGGPFVGHEDVHDGVTNLLPVDLFVPGCPPHPLTILDGLLRLIGVIE